MTKVGFEGVELTGSAFSRAYPRPVVGSPVATISNMISNNTHPCSMARRPHE